MTKPVPYPAKTEPKGWRFDLDYERIEQSTTWALAKPEVRPWLLMMWLTAWKQKPCGSLEDDDEVIAARLGMPPALFARHAKIMRRGWWLAEDGRLYHDTIVELVLEMLSKREAERDRKAAFRARQAAERAAAAAAAGAGGAAPPPDVPNCPAGQPPDSQGTPAGETAPTTYHLPPTPTTGGENPGTPPPFAGARARDPDGPDGERGGTLVDPNAGVDLTGFVPTPYGTVAAAIRKAGIGSVSPSNQRLRALVDLGADANEFVQYVPDALKQGGDPFKYLLGMVEGERRRAAERTAGLQRGRMAPRGYAVSSETDEERLAAARKAAGIATPPDRFTIDMETTHG